MKKLLILTALCASFGVQAQTDHWTTDTDTGTRFVILPETVNRTTTPGEYTVLANYFRGEQFLQRVRINVNGCPDKTGQMMVSGQTEKSDVHYWDSEGDRVFDQIAHNACKAAYVQSLFTLPAQRPVKPVKSTRSGLTT